MVKKVLLALAVVAGILAIASHGNAALTYYYNSTFSNSTVPGGTAPWLTASFENQGPGTVRLTLSTSGLWGTEFVSNWFFNIDPFTSLTFSYVSGVVATPISSLNAYQADGDGKYDILFQFPQAEKDRFGRNQTSVYDISAAGISESYFFALSNPAGGHGPYYTAAHIQSISTGAGSTFVAGNVPIPAAAWLLGSGLIGLVAVRRRMKK